MPPELPYDLDTANQLLDAGHITDSQHQQMVNLLQPAGPEAPPPLPQNAFDAVEGAPPLEATPPPMPTQAPQLAPVPVSASPSQLQNAGEGNQPQLQLASDKGVEGQNLIPQTNPLQNINGAYELQQQGVLDQVKNAYAKGAEQAAQYTAANKEMQKSLDREAAIRNEQIAKSQEFQGKLQAKLDDFDKQKVDPNHWWSSKSTGEKVLAGIGLFLGAFGTRGNQAVPVIQNAISEDIQAQKIAIENKKSGLSMQNNIYSQMLDTFKDRTAAEAATRVALLNRTQMNLNAIGARYQGPEAKAKAQELYGQLELQKQQANMMFQQAMAKSQPVNPDMANTESLTPDQKERFVPGFGLALNKERASKFVDFVQDADAAKTGITRLLGIAETPGKAVTPELRKEAYSIQLLLQGALKSSILGSGTVSDNERAMLKEIISDPTAMFSLDNNNKVALKTLLGKVNNDIAIHAKYAGIKTPDNQLGFREVKTAQK